MEPKITNLVKFYTILLLSDGPKHGYEIIRHLGEKLGKKASPGQPLSPSCSGCQAGHSEPEKGEREGKGRDMGAGKRKLLPHRHISAQL